MTNALPRALVCSLSNYTVGSGRTPLPRAQQDAARVAFALAAASFTVEIMHEHLPADPAGLKLLYIGGHGEEDGVLDLHGNTALLHTFVRPGMLTILDCCKCGAAVVPAKLAHQGIDWLGTGNGLVLAAAVEYAWEVPERGGSVFADIFCEESLVWSRSMRPRWLCERRGLDINFASNVICHVEHAQQRYAFLPRQRARVGHLGVPA